MTHCLLQVVAIRYWPTPWWRLPAPPKVVNVAAQTAPTTRYPAKTANPRPCHHPKKDQPGWIKVPYAEPITPQPKCGKSGTIELQGEGAFPESDHLPPGEKKKRAQARYDAQVSSGPHPHLEIWDWRFAPNEDPSEQRSVILLHTVGLSKNPDPCTPGRRPKLPEDFSNAMGPKGNTAYIHPSHVGR